MRTNGGGGAEGGSRTGEAKTHETLENKPDRAPGAEDESSTIGDVHDRSERAETAPGADSDPVEAALALGVRALAEAMRRASTDALSGLAERLAVVVRELEARRTAREAKTPAPVVSLDDRRRNR